MDFVLFIGVGECSQLKSLILLQAVPKTTKFYLISKQILTCNFLNDLFHNYTLSKYLFFYLVNLHFSISTSSAILNIQLSPHSSRPPYCCNGKVLVDTMIGSPERICEYFFEITSFYIKLMSNFSIKRGLFIIQWGSLLFLGVRCFSRGSPELDVPLFTSFSFFVS